jgi:hypothetical protein
VAKRIFVKSCLRGGVFNFSSGRRPGFDSRQGDEVLFLFTTASRPALGPNSPPIQWVQGALTSRVKRPGCEADH